MEFTRAEIEMSLLHAEVFEGGKQVHLSKGLLIDYHSHTKTHRLL